jgi:hypothetical protein
MKFIVIILLLCSCGKAKEWQVQYEQRQARYKEWNDLDEEFDSLTTVMARLDIRMDSAKRTGKLEAVVDVHFDQGEVLQRRIEIYNRQVDIYNSKLK